MIILGIDPSLRATGYGVIETHGNDMTGRCHGTIKNPSSLLPSRCLVRINETIGEILDKYQPGVMVVEGLVYVQNTRIGFTLGQVRGVAIAAAAARGLEIYEYAPRKVKQSVTGLGGAGKSQVAQLVKVMLGLAEAPEPDAADALGLAICHAQSIRGIQIDPAKQI